MAYLSDSQIQEFQKNGFLLIAGFADMETVQDLRQGAQIILGNFDLDQIRIFTTEDQEDVLDRYFLESTDKVRCFFEEEAFDEKGNLKVEKELAINKIGHALHERVFAFQQFSYQQNMLQLALDLNMQKPSIVQSQYIFKQPRIGGKVHAHTDSTFLYTNPLSCLGAWLALEPATKENGCLNFIPGSHHKYPLQEQYVRNTLGTGTEFVSTNHDRAEWPLDQLIPLEADPGDLVLLHGSVVHASAANRSSTSRQSYIIHLVDLACEWSPRNWLQRPSSNPFKLMQKVVNY